MSAVLESLPGARMIPATDQFRDALVIVLEKMQGSPEIAPATLAAAVTGAA